MLAVHEARCTRERSFVQDSRAEPDPLESAIPVTFVLEVRAKSGGQDGPSSAADLWRPGLTRVRDPENRSPSREFMIAYRRSTQNGTAYATMLSTAIASISPEISTIQR